MQDDDNINNFNYLIVNFNNRLLIIDDFENLKRKNYFNNKIIK